ncbi:hypothetical protein ACFUKV_36695 [Streptomyces paradoxus]|uniref:hypothetical protein n=1 Tax=Streptomyces paradoxus TaxID=66375 RepID=UPI00363356D4
MRRAGVDVELSNHGFADYGLKRMDELRNTPNIPKNPFVLGTPGTQHIMKVMENIRRGRIAQDQECSTTTPTITAAAGTHTAACC